MTGQQDGMMKRQQDKSTTRQEHNRTRPTDTTPLLHSKCKQRGFLFSMYQFSVTKLLKYIFMLKPTGNLSDNISYHKRLNFILFPSMHCQVIPTCPHAISHMTYMYNTATSHAISTRSSHFHMAFLSLPMFAVDDATSLPTTSTTHHLHHHHTHAHSYASKSHCWK